MSQVSECVREREKERRAARAGYAPDAGFANHPLPMPLFRHSIEVDSAPRPGLSQLKTRYFKNIEIYYHIID
jgi:hypothetical protein